MSKSPIVRACWLGSAPYRAVWDLQAELVGEVRDGSAPDTLLLLEHSHVFTMGRAASADHLLWDEDERMMMRRQKLIDARRIKIEPRVLRKVKNEE